MEDLKESLRSVQLGLWRGLGLLKLALVLVSLAVQAVCVVLFWYGVVTEGLETGTVPPMTCLWAVVMTFMTFGASYLIVMGYVKPVFVWLGKRWSG